MTSMQRLRLARVNAIKLKTTANIPADLIGGTGITVTRSNASYTIAANGAFLGAATDQAQTAANNAAASATAASTSATTATTKASEAASSAADAAAAAASFDLHTAAFDTYALAVASSPSTSIKIIKLLGYTAPGDDGASQWQYVAVAPSHQCYFTTANSRIYKLIETFPRPEMMGAVGDGTTTDTTAVQKISDYAGITDAVMKGRQSYKCGALTVSNAGTKWDLTGGSLLFPTLGSGVKAVTISANNFKVLGGEYVGPAASAYLASENCFEMLGTNTSTRKSGLHLEDVTIRQFGYAGVHAQFVDNIKIKNSEIYNCGYAGYAFESCDYGEIRNNKIHDITPGTVGNMYGGYLSHDSTGYSADPNAATNGKAVANPFCRGWIVDNNEVYNIAWEGLDCHGAYECAITRNRLYATHHGIAVPSSSGDAANYAGESNLVHGNVIDGRNKDGTTSGYENDSYGINLNGGSTVNHRKIVCSDNRLIYKGLISNTNSAAIQALLCTDAIIHGNTIDLWGGTGVNIGGSGATVANNRFGPVANSDANSACVRDAVPSTRKISVTGNVLDPRSGNTAGYGFTQSATPSFRPMCEGNDFISATTPYDLSVAGFCLGSDVTPRLSVSSSSSALALAGLGGFSGIVELTYSGGNYTISTFTGGVDGQEITIINTAVGVTVTIDRTQALLDGGTNKTLGQSDPIVLQKRGTAWYQKAAVMANS